MKTDLLIKNASDWKKETGIEIIYPVNNKFELDAMWRNWQRMPSNLKKQSDKKCLELFHSTNQNMFRQIQDKIKYDGYPFILHQHNPRNGSEHYDLRFLDLKDKHLLHSFALPDNFLENPDKCVLFKTRDHDPRWLTLKSYRLKNIDVGTVNYKVYKPYGYFLLEFSGKIINGLYQLFKLRDRARQDVWMFVKKQH